MKEGLALFALTLFCSMSIADKSPNVTSLDSPTVPPNSAAASAPSQPQVSTAPLTPLQALINDLIHQQKQAELAGGDVSAIAASLRKLGVDGREQYSPLNQGADLCPAFEISSLPFNDTGTTSGMSNDYTPTCSSSNAPDVIYAFRVLEEGVHTLSTCGSSFDNIIEIRSGSDCPGSNLVGCNDDACGVQAEITQYLYAGQYYVIIDGYLNYSGDYVLNVTGPTPEGDDCATAYSISAPWTYLGSTCDYYNTYDYSCPWPSSSRDVIYRYDPMVHSTETTYVTFSLCRSSYDTKLYIYQDNCSGTPIACSDDAVTCPCSTGVYRSYVECLALSWGHVYYVVVDGYGGACGEFQLDASLCSSCDVTSEPEDITESAENCWDANHYFDDPNGGCNVTPNQFDQVQIGQTVQGSVFTYVYNQSLVRDTDWFLFTLTESESIEVICLESECDLKLGISDLNNCETLIYYTSYPKCAVPGGIVTPCLPAGDYALFVAPLNFFGEPEPRDYRVALVARPCSPPNDDCAEAIELDVNEPGANCASNVGATTDCSGGYTPTIPDVWHTFTLSECMFVAIEFCGTGPSSMEFELYRNSCCGEWVDLFSWDVSFCEDGSQTWRYYLQPGQYWFPVRLNPQGSYCVKVTGVSGAPESDFCENATPFSIGAWTVGSTLCSTVDNIPDCSGPASAPGVWFKLTGNGGTVRMTTCGFQTKYDTRLSVFSCDCGSMTCITANDDADCANPATASIVTWCTEPGEEYLVLVHGYGTESGTYYLESETVPDIPCVEPICCPDGELYTSQSYPVSISGNTLGAGNDCSYLPTADWRVLVHTFEEGWWRFSTCGSSFETRLFVSQTCCGEVVHSASSWCAPPDGPEEICLYLFPGLTYATIEGEGGGPFILTVDASAPPAQVTGVQASDNLCSGVNITWNDVESEYQYYVWRDGTAIAVTSANVNSFFDSFCAPGTYAYTVMAQNSCVGGQVSGAESGTRLSAPTPVSDLAAQIWNEDAEPLPDDIRLTWTAASGFSGTFSIYTNSAYTPYPGAGWTLLAEDIMPVAGPDAMHYVHVDCSATEQQLYYVVVAVCL